MSTVNATSLEVRIDTTAKGLRTPDGEVDRMAVARVLIRLGLALSQSGLTPGGVWGGRLQEGGAWVGYWSLHAGGETE